MMLKRGDEKGHPCLVPNLGEKVLSFSLLGMMLAVGLFLENLYQAEEVSLYS